MLQAQELLRKQNIQPKSTLDIRSFEKYNTILLIIKQLWNYVLK